MAAPGSTIPDEFQREAGLIASRLIRKLKLCHSGRVALARELELLIKTCTDHTIKMVEEEFILTPRGKDER